ncbi:MAG: DUF3782 domain-containing protein [Candidatus Kryptonium sp.]|nr:DUF3782 domain-containing protein [Candidatus Kryptonium sp.]MCX7761452.1 DUF3782 domain-containing protein [Candidatus Kryptonium sp.]
MRTKKETKAEEIIKKLPEIIESDSAFRQRLFAMLLEYFPSRQEYNYILKGINEILERQEEHSRVIKELTEKIDKHSQILEELIRGQERHSQILEEHAKAIRELSERQERHSQILEEHAKAIRELSEKVDRHSQILEELIRGQERHSQILEEHARKLEEHSKAIEMLVKEVYELKITVGGLVKEMGDMKVEFARLSDAVYKLKVTIGNIGARWGIMTEDMFRKAYEEILKSLFGLEYKVEKRKIKYDDKESEIDIVISDAKEVIVEVSASMNKKKAERIAEKIKAYRKETGKEVPAYVISASASAESVVLLRDENINIITPEAEEEEFEK